MRLILFQFRYYYSKLNLSDVITLPTSGIILKSIMDLASHRRRVIAFECNFCDKLFKRKELLVKHLASHQETVPLPVEKKDEIPSSKIESSTQGIFEKMINDLNQLPQNNENLKDTVPILSGKGEYSAKKIVKKFPILFTFRSG